MRKYSHYFETLHDEQCPAGYLGRGTHYSVLRAIVFHDPMGKTLPVAQFANFAVIWDEDHDERVIEPIEHIYRSGLLPSFIFFGERKGSFTAILSDDVRDQQRRIFLKEHIERITQLLDDPWPADVTGADSDEGHIISDDRAKVAIYLANLKMLWQLGTKAAGTSKDNHMR